MKYFSYRRVSKDPKDTGSVSLEWQAAEIKRWLASKKRELSGDFVDDGVSAKRPLHRRKGGAELMWATEKGNCVVIVAKVDRIFRDTQDFLTTVNEWARRNVTLESVNDHLDLVSPTGEFIATVMAAVNQLERRTTGERNRTRGMHRKKTGLRHCAYAPYGFRWEGMEVDEDGKTTGGTPVPDEAEQRWIAKMREWQRNGWSLREIAAELNKLKVPTRKGGPWIHTSVQKVIDTARARLSKKRREDGKGYAAPDLSLHVGPEEKDGEE